MFKHPTIKSLGEYVGQTERAQASQQKNNLPENLKRGKNRLKQLSQRSQRTRKASDEPRSIARGHPGSNGFEIAIIGMAGCFPGAENIEEFWHNLRDGVESITCFSEAELAAAGVNPAVLNDPNYVKAWSVLADAELFDAPFFGFTPREAEIMDPQHRLFLNAPGKRWKTLAMMPSGFKARSGYTPAPA